MRFPWRGIPLFTRRMGNIVQNLKRMGEDIGDINSPSYKRAVEEYRIQLEKNIDDNLSGKKIEMSQRSLVAKTLLSKTVVDTGGAGPGVRAISVKIKGNTGKVNMVGRARNLDRGGLIKANKRFLTIPLGGRSEDGGLVKKSVRDYNPEKTFQIYADPTLRKNRVTKRKNRLAPRYLVVRGAGREFQPVYLFTPRIKTKPYYWLKDATVRAKKKFEKDLPLRIRAANVLARSDRAKKA